MNGKLTYGSYLSIDQLLALQRPQSEPVHHDEMLFIIIHQVYELWFKQMLHEVEAVVRYLDADDPLKATRAFARIHAVQRVLEQRLNAPTVYDSLKSFLARRGYKTGDHDALIETFRTIYDGADQHVDLYVLLEAFIEFDERFLLWRGRHIRMVERMIGFKPGTGGSMGVRYLETTLQKKFFPELWEVRTVLGTEVSTQ